MIRCSSCQIGTMKPGTVDDHDVSALFGLDAPVLIARAPALVCDHCGAVMLEGDVIEAAEEALAQLLVESGGELRASEARFLRDVLGLSAAALAERLGVDAAAVERWEAAGAPLAEVHALALRSLAGWRLVEKKPSLLAELSARFTRPQPATAARPYRIARIAA